MKPQNYIFELPYGKITSVVVDEDEFSSFCDDIAKSGVFASNADERVTDDIVGRIRSAKYLPMAKRGTLTEPFFRRFGVRTNLMCVIVRGEGKNLVEDLYNRVKGLQQ